MKNRRYYKITLTTSEPFRVGGVKDPTSRADNQVARLGNMIIIPGPTLKGALRHRIEKFLINKFYQSKKWLAGMEDFQPCIPGTPTEDERGLIEQGKYRRNTCYYASKDREKSTPTICPVCYLLGANGLLGFVRVPFLRLIKAC